MSRLLENITEQIHDECVHRGFMMLTGDAEAIAQSAIAAVFDWLDNPSEAAKLAGWKQKERGPNPVYTFYAMLSVLRKEALGGAET